MIRFLFLLLLFICFFKSGLGCGLDWTTPHAHFSGVDEHGYVSYWEKIADVDLGEGLSIPLNINFNSHREAESPILGKGWMVPLLESHTEPLNENSLNVVMPDGWTFIFYRKGTSNTWIGNSKWVGESRGTSFVISAPCGWKIKYDAGKIQEISTDKNEKIQYEYDAKLLTKITEGKKSIFYIERNQEGVATYLYIGDQKIEITLYKRPRITTILNQNVITGYDQCIANLYSLNKLSSTFQYKPDKELNPAVQIEKLDGNFSYIWNPITRQIKNDGTWTYSFKAIEDAASVAISRRNAEGKMESFSDNPLTGVRTELGIDEVTKVTTRFVDGVLRGQVRKIETISKGVTTKIFSANYDEFGRSIKRSSPTDEYIYSYDSKLRLPTKLIKNGVQLWIRTYRDDGKIRSITYYDKTQTFFYKDDSEWIKTVNLISKKIDPKIIGQIDSITITKGEVINFTSYNKTGGKPLLELFPDTKIISYEYNKNNAIEKIFKDGVLNTVNNYSSSGKLIQISRYSELDKKFIDQKINN